MYVEARLCSHCCSAEAKGITYSAAVFAALGIQRCNAHVSYCRLWPGQHYNIFLIVSQMARFSKKKKN